MDLTGSLKKFANDFIDGLARPSALTQKALLGVKPAIQFLVFAAVLSTLASTALMSVPLAYSYLTGGSQSMDAVIDEIPEFAITDGTFRFTDNVTQPYYVTEYIVVDTTGQVTEAPVNEQGQGILVTSKKLIKVDGGRTQTVKFSELGQDMDKEDLADFIKSIRTFMVPFILLVMAAFNLFWFTAVPATLALVVCAAFWGLARLQNRELSFNRAFTVSAYAMAPVFAVGTLTSLVSGYFLSFVGVLWAGAVAGTALLAAGGEAQVESE